MLFSDLIKKLQEILENNLDANVVIVVNHSNGTAEIEDIHVNEDGYITVTLEN